jgi:hypothetical protein
MMTVSLHAQTPNPALLARTRMHAREKSLKNSARKNYT